MHFVGPWHRHNAWFLINTWLHAENKWSASSQRSLWAYRSAISRMQPNMTTPCVFYFLLDLYSTRSLPDSETEQLSWKCFDSKSGQVKSVGYTQLDFGTETLLSQSSDKIPLCVLRILYLKRVTHRLELRLNGYLQHMEVLMGVKENKMEYRLP